MTDEQQKSQLKLWSVEVATRIGDKPTADDVLGVAQKLYTFVTGEEVTTMEAA